MSDWREKYSAEQLDLMEIVGYKLATGRIDEVDARIDLQKLGFEPVDAEEYIDEVIEGPRK